MEPTRLLAPAKVNLGLQVIRRRPDGYHELRTFFQAIDLSDELRLVAAPDRLELHTTGEAVPAGEENLVLRAAAALRRFAAAGCGARIELTKRIPVGAGLGGGSSDAAAALLGLRRLWRMETPFRTLVGIARRLGADVPFFLYGGAAYATGRGDRIRPLDGVLDRHLLIVCPGDRLRTGSVFDSGGFGLTPRGGRIRMGSFSQALSGRLDLADLILNDLEEPAIRLCPEIDAVKRNLREVGAEAVSMTGSGPAVFGLFSDRGEAAAAAGRLRRKGRFVAVSSPVSRRNFRD